MNNTQISEAFAKGKTTGHGSNIFIDGTTIFSYGYHFPIARITDKKDENGKTIALFTNRGYSNSTAKHKNHVWGALNREGYRIITCDISGLRIDNEVIKLLKEEVEKLYQKATRARKEYIKESYNRQAGELVANIITLKNVFVL